VINDQLATTAFGGRDPIGRLVQVNNDPPFRVIGVVGNVAYDERGSRSDHVYLSHTQFASNRNWPLSYVVRTNGAPERVIAPARTALASIDPALVLHLPQTMESLLGDHRARQEFTLLLMGLFAAVALSLAAVGIYGVLAYTVTQRTREIGVRMALGAHAAHVRRLVVSEGMLVAGLGMFAGLAGAFGLATFLRSLVFEVSPRDPVVYAAVAGVLTLVVGLAAYIPTRRATRIDPVEALR
jgi:putative ABC transport system permease protein